MSETRNSSSTGTAICLVTLSVLVALKLTGSIDWSWWVVTSPLWGPIVFGLMFAGLAIAVVLVALLPLSAFKWIAGVVRKNRTRRASPAGGCRSCPTCGQAIFRRCYTCNPSPSDANDRIIDEIAAELERR